MATEARTPSRGPKPNPDRGTPSGYRVNSRTRFELQLAAAFVGTSSLQETIDLAVSEFLARLHAEAVGYPEAIRAAERHQQHRAGVQRLQTSDEGSSP